jgi:hypothetical protein
MQKMITFYSQKSSFTHGRVIFAENSELFTNLEKHDLESSFEM